VVSDTQKLVISPSPHLKGKETVSSAMRDVFIALIPIAAVAIYFYHLYAAFLIGVCLVTAVLTELLFKKLQKKKPALHDWSALLTGLFVALLFTATSPWWKAAIATFIAVGIAKELMGGLGWNRFNPALFGRVALIVLAPIFAFVDDWFTPLAVNLGSVDVVTQATPLAMLNAGMEMPPLGQLFLAFPGGALSEVSPLALLIGAAYLFYRKHITWHVPVSMLAAIAVLTLIAGQNPLYHLFTGGIMIGAFFMATDWVTSPFTDRGKLIFGACIGILVVIFRLGLSPTEGVAFSILIMNAFVPYIDKAMRRPSFSDPKKQPQAS